MKILFCDLCNESVPQSELDGGRAFMRKGRVVCVKCDQLMTQREEAGQPSAQAAAQVSSAALPVQSVLTPLPAPGPGPDAGHAAGTQAPHHHHHSHAGHGRGQRGGSGVAVGLFAMAFTACAIYWLMEQSARVSADVGARLDAVQREQKDADRRAMDRTTELTGELVLLRGHFDSSVDAEHKAVERRLEELQRTYSQAQAALSELRTAIESMGDLKPSLQRHDQELNSGAQHLAQLEGRARAQEAALEELRKELEERSIAAASTPAALPATPSGAPAWMGLVQQLESANSGDRWVAVQSLGETRDPAVAEYILPRLKDVDIFVRMVAARVLGDLGSPKAIGALIDSLSDQDPAVREASYLALCSVSKKSFPFEPYQEPVDRAKKVKVWQDWWKKAQEEGATQ